MSPSGERRNLDTLPRKRQPASTGNLIGELLGHFGLGPLQRPVRCMPPAPSPAQHALASAEHGDGALLGGVVEDVVALPEFFAV